MLLVDRETGEMLSVTLVTAAEGLDATAVDAEMEAVRGVRSSPARMRYRVGQRFEVVAQVR